MAEQVDLLGDPWTEARDPRGRKRHRRTVQIAEKVAVLRASGLTVEQIAARTLLSEPTLRKYYFRELDHGVHLARAVLVEAQWDKAKGGNTAAARFVDELFTRGDIQSPKRAAAPKAPKLGKKAAADAAAQNAHEGTGWGDLLPN